MIELLFFLLICSLTMNLYPVVNILIVGAFCLVYVLYRRKKNPCPLSDPTKWVIYACAFWAVSYFVTTGSIENFFSFDFLRRDGNIFFAYLPIIVVGYGLKLERAHSLLRIYLGMMSFLAAVGAIQFAAGVGLIPNFLHLLPDSWRWSAVAIPQGWNFTP